MRSYACPSLGVLDNTFIRLEEMTAELMREWVDVTDAFAKVYARSKKSDYDKHPKVATHRDKGLRTNT